MGVSNYDFEGTQRRLDAMYLLTTPDGVTALLEDWEQLLIRPFDRGDYGVIDLILDMQVAVANAELTDKQWQAIDLVLIKGYTQQEVGDMEGVSQQSIQKRVFSATKKIAEVYHYWHKRGAY